MNKFASATANLRARRRHPRRVRPLFTCSVLLGVVSLIASHSAKAANGNDVWTGATDNAWATAGNWTAGSVNKPPISGDNLSFSTTTGVGGTLLNNNLTSSAFNLGSGGAGVTAITFNFNAPSYVIGDGTTTANAGNTFTLAGNIVNSGTNLQTINNPIVLTAGRFVNMTSGGGNVALNGNISGSGAGLTPGGSGVLYLNGNNSFTGVSNTIGGIALNNGLFLNTGTMVVLGSNTAAGTGTIDFSTVGATLSAVSGGVTIANGIFNNNVGGTFGAGGNITVNGLFQFGGTATITVNNNTTLAGGIDIRDGTASTVARTGTFAGSGNVTISGAIINGSAGAAGSIAYNGTGTMTLSGTGNTYTGGDPRLLDQ